MKSLIGILVILVHFIVDTASAEQNVTYLGAYSPSAAGVSMGANQSIIDAFQGVPNMRGPSRFFQAYLNSHAMTHFLQGVLGAASAYPAIANWDQQTDLVANFQMTDSSGASIGYYVVASANPSYVPANLQSSFSLSLAISLGTTAASAQQSQPCIFVYFASGATGSQSNGVMVINNLNPAKILVPSSSPSSISPPPDSVPGFSGYYIWKNPNDGINHSQAIGLMSMVPSVWQLGQPGAPGVGMTVFYEQDIDPTTGGTSVGFTINIPAAGANPALVGTMAGSGTLGLNPANGQAVPVGDWTVAVQPIPSNQWTANTLPAFTSATTVNFAAPGAVPTFVSSAATPPAIDQSLISPAIITNSGANTCGPHGNQVCTTFAAASVAAGAPAIPPGMLPPPPGPGAIEPPALLQNQLQLTNLVFNPQRSENIVDFATLGN